jgi:hypothetical protein
MADKCKTCGTKKSEKAMVWMLGSTPCPACGRVPFKEKKPKEKKPKK